MKTKRTEISIETARVIVIRQGRSVGSHLSDPRQQSVNWKHRLSHWLCRAIDSIRKNFSGFKRRRRK